MPKYNVRIDTYAPIKYPKLSEAEVGKTVTMLYNGKPRQVVLLHHGKPSSIYSDTFNNGAIMGFADIPFNYICNTAQNNVYNASMVHTLLNAQVYNSIEDSIKSKIKEVKLPWTNASNVVESGENGLSCYCLCWL